MKTAHLSWEEVRQRAGGKAIVVHYDGIVKSGYCDEEHMEKMVRNCELMQLTSSDYQVTKWPDKRSGN